MFKLPMLLVGKVHPVNFTRLLSPGQCFSLKISESPQICEAWDLQKVKSSLKHPPEQFPPLFQYCRSSFSLHHIHFQIWKYSFSFPALISGLLCCSCFSLRFALLWGIPFSDLQICIAADAKHSQGCKDVPSTLQIKAVLQNSAALN